MSAKASGSTSSNPVYLQIANVLRAQIVSDSQQHRLASEQGLAKIHGVARGTIRCALDVLAREGLIARTPGQPTITIPDGVLTYQRLRRRRAIVVFAVDWSSPEIPTGYYGQIYQGILAAAEQAGYRCVLRWVEGKFSPTGEAVDKEDALAVLGVINLHILDRSLVTRYVEMGLPVVCVDHWPLQAGADGVVVDCFGEAHQAVNFLQAHGHRELFYVGNVLGAGANRQPETDSLFMEAGYRHALQLAGLGSSANRVHYCRQEEIGDLAEWFVAQRPRPTAGIVFSSVAMEEFVQELRRRGIRCPQDVSLLCKTYEGQSIKAASVCTDAFNLGSCAAELLIGRAAGKQRAGMRVAIESRLIPGPTVRAIDASS
jgi:DNA-binding LacI/PurR family transcriptional regulator